MSSVCDIAGNTRMLDGIVCGAFFLIFFPKTHRKRTLFKARERIQVSGHIHFEHVLFSRVVPRYSNLKLF